MNKSKSRVAVGSRPDFWGHPKGLYILFFTEMWERFSYYGMRVLLVLYMTQHLLKEAENGVPVYGLGAIKIFIGEMIGSSLATSHQAIASQVYGIYTGLVFFTPLLGGILADRYLGQNRSVYLGSLLMAAGHFLMAIESWFFAALFLLILGNGCFKPNISSRVGGLYSSGDPRRDGAYTIFYMGINLGSFFSPFICGTLGQKWGWHYGFSAAGIGMLISLAIYHWGQSYLPLEVPRQPQNIPPPVKPNKVPSEDWADFVSKKFGLKFSKKEKRRIWALFFLCGINTLFWAIYEQQGNTLELWADARTDWKFFSWELPSSWYQSFNPFLIFLLAPVLDRLWAWQRQRRREPTTITKMGLGCLLAGLAFIVMIWPAHFLQPDERGSVLWLFGSALVLTLGELYISPIGLSLVSKLAPVRAASILMGMWFLSSFVGNYLSGFLGSYYEVLSKEAFFGGMALIGVVAAGLFFAANIFLKENIL